MSLKKTIKIYILFYTRFCCWIYFVHHIYERIAIFLLRNRFGQLFMGYFRTAILNFSSVACTVADLWRSYCKKKWNFLSVKLTNSPVCTTWNVLSYLFPCLSIRNPLWQTLIHFYLERSPSVNKLKIFKRKKTFCKSRRE